VQTLVTGGAGFIGSNLVDALLPLGHDVLVLDDFSSGNLANVVSARDNGAVITPLDIRDGVALANAVRNARPKGHVPVSRRKDVRKSVLESALDARTNVEDTITVLEAARLTHARVINVSTGGAIYGRTDVLPTPEHVEPVPQAPYGLSKYRAEQCVRLYARLFCNTRRHRPPRQRLPIPARSAWRGGGDRNLLWTCRVGPGPGRYTERGTRHATTFTWTT